MKHIQEYLEDPGCHPPPEVGRFLNGDCHLFAIAIHRLTGWQIAAFTEPRFVIPDGITPEMAYAKSLELPKNEKLPYAIRPGLIHAVCLSKHYGNEYIFDAKGWRKAQELHKEYAFHSECKTDFYTAKELYNIVHRDEEMNEAVLTDVVNFVKQHYYPLFKKV